MPLFLANILYLITYSAKSMSLCLYVCYENGDEGSFN